MHGLPNGTLRYNEADDYYFAFKAIYLECRFPPIYTSKKKATRCRRAGQFCLALEGRSMSGKGYRCPSPRTVTMAAHEGNCNTSFACPVMQA